VARGAYILADADGGKPQVILMATGSEVYLCIDAYEKTKGRRRSGAGRQHAIVGVVRASGPELSRSSVSARRHRASRGRTGIDFGWAQYTGTKGRIIGMRTFGASAPLKDLQKKFGFTSDAILQAAHEVIGK